MGFDLQPFIQNISEYGLAYTSKFDMTIALPPAMQSLASNASFSFINQMSQLMPYRTLNCSTPGVAFKMNETNKWGVGPTIKSPYNAGFADLKVTFLADSDSIIESFFNTWMGLSYNFGFSQYTQASFYVGYRSLIASPTVQINKYDRAGDLFTTYILSGCVPTYFVPTGLDWEEQNTISKFTLGLNYTSYDIQ